jgi:hypothetical protein
MRKKIAWGPDDVKGLFIKEDGESIPYTSEIRERINDHLIDACKNGHNLVLLCKRKKYSRTTHVEVHKNGVPSSFWDNPNSADNTLTKCFEKAISDFKKKWGEKLTEEKVEQRTKYRFLMF